MAPQFSRAMRFPKYTYSLDIVANLPKNLAGLRRLAENLHWTWSHETRELFREIDRRLWDEVEHNPIQLLSKAAPERLERLSSDEAFLARLVQCEGRLDEYLAAKTWFHDHHANAAEHDVIAYFCAEFGLTEALPIYSGGLGVLAGDHLKAASDLGLPLVGVGLLYAHGYFRQSLSPDGWQLERYPQSDFHKLPIQLVRGPDDRPIRIEVDFPDRTITCQIWKAIIGRVSLILLDSNVLENAPSDQEITDTLYGGDQEMRIRQEIILGVGGMRALAAIGLRPVVCHMNEGHAAFLSLERIRQIMAGHGLDFATARKLVASSNVFTTHTPVPAGFDLFPAELLQKYTSNLVEPTGISFKDLLKLGRQEPENEGEGFNMALLAMANANRVNGVSELHAKVTRNMFHWRWQSYPEDEVPIAAVTNGIHTSTWVGRKMSDLFDEYLGPKWRTKPGDPESWKGIFDIPDDELWEARENQRGDLIRFIRRKRRADAARMGAAQPVLAAAEYILDPRLLTIGFARRFATYKRATLMLSNRERLKSIIFHPERPVQIVIAGKSHPKDDGGKALIQDLYNFIHREGAETRMVFLEDYDLEVARRMVQGVDVWLNNPRRPHEASGTSGMKVVPNGGLNCSILDGWWDEGFDAEVGWAIGDGREYADPDQQDWIDSHSLYQLIEAEIAPKFYHRAAGSAPTAWIQMVKQSISRLAPQFSTYRMVVDYATKCYLPAWDSFFALEADGAARAVAAVAWRDKVSKAFPGLSILSVTHSAGVSESVGTALRIDAKVELGTLETSDIRVEVVWGPVGSNREVTFAEAVQMGEHSREGSIVEYATEFTPGTPGHHGFAVRIVPSHPDVDAKTELRLVRWCE